MTPEESEALVDVAVSRFAQRVFDAMRAACFPGGVMVTAAVRLLGLALEVLREEEGAEFALKEMRRLADGLRGESEKPS